MDVLEAELAVLVSETEEEVVNNPDDGIAITSRYFEPHCPIVCMYSWSYGSPPPVCSLFSEDLRNLTSPSPCLALLAQCVGLPWPLPQSYCRS